MAFFVDRRREYEAIVTSAKSKLNLIVFGKRGSGKTSLLNYVSYQLKNKNDVIPISLNILPSITNSESFLKLLLDACAKHFNSNIKSQKLHAGHENDFTHDVSDLFQETMEIYKKRKQKIVFLIDNFDHYVESYHAILGSLREILWSVGYPLIIVADINKKNEYIKPPLDAFFDKQLEIKPMETHYLMQLFDKRLGKDFLSEKLILEIEKATNESIWDSILIIRELLEKNNFDPTTLTANPDAFHENETKHIKYIQTIENSLHDLSYIKRQIVRFLLMHGPSSASDIKLQNHTSVTRSRLTQIFRELEQKKIVEKSKETKGHKTVYAVGRHLKGMNA